MHEQLSREDPETRRLYELSDPRPEPDARPAGPDVERAGGRAAIAGRELGGDLLPLRPAVELPAGTGGLVGASPLLHRTLAFAKQVAPTDSTVLITGETGTGKELLARAIHAWSRRSARAFVAVNCAAIPQSLIATELFGHEKGAFTDALQLRPGRFELAAGGTLFLDEVGDLPMATQIALLRVLQEHEFERVGGTASIRADVRIIAATNRDLLAAVEAGPFRRDLYYRLNVFPIEMPPLRRRPDDVRSLVEYFVDGYARRAGKTIRAISRQTLALLEAHPWPGNIRELQNVVERSVIVCDSETLSLDETWIQNPTTRSVPQPGRERSAAPPSASPRRGVQPPLGPLPAARPRPVDDVDPLSASPSPAALTLAEIARAAILRALDSTNGVLGGPRGAAALLGMKRTTLQARMHKLGIKPIRSAFATSASTAPGQLAAQPAAPVCSASDSDAAAAALPGMSRGWRNGH